MQSEKLFNKHNVIIVEDEPGHRVLLRKKIVELGVNTNYIEFANGLEFINYVKTNINDFIENTRVVFLDIRLPIADGHEVLQFLAANGETSEMPVIIVTTTDDETDLKKCKNLGYHNIVKKPVSRNDLNNALQNLN